MKILIVCAFLSLVHSLECDYDRDCNSVSLNPNYVDCVQGLCVCREANGFVGEATLESKCACPFSVYGGNGGPYCKQCDAPRTIEYDNQGVPRCLNKAECEDRLITRYNRMRNLVVGFWKAIADKRNFELEEFFTPDLKGRADPYTLKGVRNNPMLAVEELIYDRDLNFRSFVIQSLTIDPLSNVVQSIVNIEVLVAFIGYNTNVTLQVTWSFNQEATKIAQYEYHAQNLAATVDTTFATTEGLIRGNFNASSYAALGVNVSNPINSARNLVMNQICRVHSQYCAPNATLKQFSSFGTCMAFMRTLPHGHLNFAWRNTVNCRSIHQNLIPFNPATHCQHIGPSSTTCRDDVPRSLYYKDRFLPNFNPIVLLDVNDNAASEIIASPALDCKAP